MADARVLELLDRLEAVRNWLNADTDSGAPREEIAAAIALVWQIHGEVV